MRWKWNRYVWLSECGKAMVWPLRNGTWNGHVKHEDGVVTTIGRYRGPAVARAMAEVISGEIDQADAKARSAELNRELHPRDAYEPRGPMRPKP